MAHLWLPEREHVRLGAGLEQRDLQGSFVGRVMLAYELVQAAGPEQAVPSSSTSTTGRARSLAVDEHAAGNRLRAPEG